MFILNLVSILQKIHPHIMYMIEIHQDRIFLCVMPKNTFFEEVVFVSNHLFVKLELRISLNIKLYKQLKLFTQLNK